MRVYSTRARTRVRFEQTNERRQSAGWKLWKNSAPRTYRTPSRFTRERIFRRKGWGRDLARMAGEGKAARDDNVDVDVDDENEDEDEDDRGAKGTFNGIVRVQTNT